jgi:hypothetical protein
MIAFGKKQRLHSAHLDQKIPSNLGLSQRTPQRTNNTMSINDK